VAYREKNDDLISEILAELYLRHITHKTKSPHFGDAKNLLAFLRKSPPPQRDTRDLTLSSYFRLTRTDNQISLGEIAAAIGTDVSEVIKLESNTSLPWESEPQLMADLACLYQIDLPTLRMLSSNSLNIAYFSERIKNREQATESMAQWLVAVQGELKSRGASGFSE